MRSAGWAMATLALLAAAAAGCGATCDRIEEDRERFLGRKPKADGAHVEVLVPFAVAERLIGRGLVPLATVERAPTLEEAFITITQENVARLAGEGTRR